MCHALPSSLDTDRCYKHPSDTLDCKIYSHHTFHHVSNFLLSIKPPPIIYFSKSTTLFHVKNRYALQSITSIFSLFHTENLLSPLYQQRQNTDKTSFYNCLIPKITNRKYDRNALNYLTKLAYVCNNINERSVLLFRRPVRGVGAPFEDGSFAFLKDSYKYRTCVLFCQVYFRTNVRFYVVTN